MAIKILEDIRWGRRKWHSELTYRKVQQQSIPCRAYAIAEAIEHEGANVDGARGGSQEDNELKKTENIPALWHDNKLFAHKILRNRDLRHAVK